MSWSGSERARRPQGMCRPPAHEATVEVLFVPAGTWGWVRRVTESDWQQFATTRDCKFLRAEYVDGSCLVFRQDGWQLRIPSRAVVRRNEQANA